MSTNTPLNCSFSTPYLIRPLALITTTPITTTPITNIPITTIPVTTTPITTIPVTYLGLYTNFDS